MASEQKDQVPASACRLAGGAVEFAETQDRPDGVSVTPIRMLARSAEPIEHPWWGVIVHDMAGMTVHKERIPIDYVHDEPIGYLDKFDATNKGLWVEGMLVATGEASDPLAKILKRSKGGVPYESSINFGGDGIKVEWLGEDQVATVNGYTFEGPGVIVREWPLRGVAVCPYGADMHTESQFSADQFFSLSQSGDRSMPTTTTTKTKQLSEAPAGDASAAPAAPTTPTAPAAEVKPAETAAEAAPTPAADALSQVRSEMNRFRKAFGDKGAVYFADGISFEEASERHVKELQESKTALANENAELRKKLGLASQATGEQTPVSFEASDEQPKRGGFESKLRLPPMAAAKS